MRSEFDREPAIGAAMLTGEIGCGKTILSRTLIQDLPQDRYEVGLIANPFIQMFGAKNALAELSTGSVLYVELSGAVSTY